jgi:hypothetical protein
MDFLMDTSAKIKENYKVFREKIEDLKKQIGN